MAGPRHFKDHLGGGPIALVKNSDTITIDAENREVTIESRPPN
jgi:dihydroxyacid dehydratase/phosphogluconate dehydratase